MSNRCVNLSSLVGVCLDVIALSVSRQPIGLLCKECRLALAPVLGGHLAAARKRSHQWCLTLTPNNTETVERMTCHCFIVFCDQAGDTLRAAPTHVVLGVDKRFLRRVLLRENGSDLVY